MFSDPVKNLKFFGLREDAIVADLGAGTGFYSIAAGHMVPRGKVYAVDILKDFLITIRNKARDAGLQNVDTLWGDVEKMHGTGLGDSVADVVIVSNVLFQIEDKNQFIQEIKRILKTGGRVLLVDWHDEIINPAFSSDSKIRLKGILSEKQAHEMFERKGFALDRDVNTGIYHYGMILIKK